MYKKNASNPGIFTINSGVKNIMEFGQVEAFRGRSKVPHWTGETCNAVKGTDGSAFHPQVTRDETLYVFNTDLCRSLFFEYERDSKVRGIPTYKYSVPDRFYKAPANDKANACFCTSEFGLADPLCKIDGILDVSKCKNGAPIVISAPHFYQGDPLLRMNVSGLYPQKDKHETFLEIEPLTGLVFKAARRIQINIRVKNHADTPSVSTVNDMIMPLLWLEESAMADEVSAEKFKTLIQNKLVIVNAIFIAAMVTGLTIFLLAVILVAYKASRVAVSKEQEARQDAKKASYSSLPQKDEL